MNIDPRDCRFLRTPSLLSQRVAAIRSDYPAALRWNSHPLRTSSHNVLCRWSAERPIFQWMMISTLRF